MFRCARCKNSGKIQDQYAEFKPLTVPLYTGQTTVAVNEVAPIKTRTVECPECLGFGAVGWALPG
jgi:DNA-directed RNA polymerase subunit RPC12/RpoP